MPIDMRIIIMTLNGCAQRGMGSVEMSAAEVKALIERIEEVSGKKFTDFIKPEEQL